MGIGYNPSLTNIDGLSNLITFDGDLGIGYNATLNNLEGLSNITTVNDLGILENAALTNVDGLVNLTTIGGDLIIVNNPVLTNINGFSNITSAGDLWVGENAALTNVDGLVNLTTLGNLTILGNAALTNIDSLVNVTSISDSLVISDNVSLTNCCGIKQLLETPGAIAGSITIENNPSECSSTDEILNSPCNKCWEEDLLKFCLTSSQWEPVEGEENKIEATDIVSINEFLFFEGHLVIDTIELDISAEGEFYVENIPLPGGSTGKYLLSEGEFDLKLLGSDGIITDFLNSDIEGTPKIFETELKLDEIKLVKINNETGLKLKCTITVPGISGDCGDEPGTNTEIQLDGLGITAAGISLDGVNVKDLGMYIPKFCLKQLTVQYDSPKDILTAGAEVSMPFGEIGGGLKLEEGLIDSIGWMIEASSPPFVLGTTTIGIKGFFGQIANITKPAIEVELGGIFSDIISDDFYRITAKGKTVWPTNFEISGTGQFMRPLSNDLPFQLQGGLSVGYDIPNSLLNVQVNGNFGTLNEEKWLMSGDGLLRVNHRTTNTTFNGYFNGLMNVDVDVFVDDPPMPLPYIISVIGLPFSVGTKNTVHYGNNKNFFGSITLEHFLLGSYDLSYLIDLTLPMSHEDYFFWDGIKNSASRSQNRLDGEQIIVPRNKRIIRSFML